VSESDRGKELMRDIMDAAYSAQRDTSASSGSSGPSGPGATSSGQKFAEELFSTCMKSGGDMDNVLGRRS
jgi:hypothetical protein